MSRKPVDQLSKSRKPQGQDGVWAEIRKRKTFIRSDIWDATGIPKKTVTDYINRLEAGGYVAWTGQREDAAVYTLMKDAGVHPPRIRPNGEPVQQGKGTENIWRSMRMLRQFTPRDIVAHSNTDTVTVSDATAQSYCSILLRAGYLRVLRKAQPGKHQATYKLIRNTGPLPPQIQRVKQVFDQNLGEVTYRPGAGQ